MIFCINVNKIFGNSDIFCILKYPSNKKRAFGQSADLLNRRRPNKTREDTRTNISGPKQLLFTLWFVFSHMAVQ